MTAPAAGSGSLRRHVGRFRATALTYRVLVRQIVTPGRLVALAALGGLMILVGWVIGSAADAGRPAEVLLEDAAAYADGFGLIIMVPIVSLVFASAVLGETREDGTLVYLWLRPMDRSPVVAGAAAAAATAALPLAVIPTVLGGWLAADRVAGSGELAAGSLAAAALGTAAYSALFVLLGLLVRKPIMWGIGYVLLWEGLAAGLDFTATFALHRYTRSLLIRIADVDLGHEANSTVVAVVVLAVVVAAGLALSAIRLSRMDVS